MDACSLCEALECIIDLRRRDIVRVDDVFLTLLPAEAVVWFSLVNVDSCAIGRFSMTYSRSANCTHHGGNDNVRVEEHSCDFRTGERRVQWSCAVAQFMS